MVELLLTATLINESINDMKLLFDASCMCSIDESLDLSLERETSVNGKIHYT